MRDQVAEGEEEGESELAYLKMPNWQYYSLTLGLYISCVLASIFITNIGAVFEFVGAFGLSITSFTLPGVMYLLMLRNPKAFLEIESAKQRRWNKVGAISMITLSVFNMILVVMKQIFPGNVEEN